MNDEQLLDQILSLQGGMLVSMSPNTKTDDHDLTSIGDSILTSIGDPVKVASPSVVSLVEIASPKETDNGDALNTNLLLQSIDYYIKIKEQSDLVDFANQIRHFVAMQMREKFSAIRLSTAKLIYDDWLCVTLRGKTTQTLTDTTITVKQSESALQLAGTVIHELAHVLVGPESKHNKNWIEACYDLGLVNALVGQEYKPDDFSPSAQNAIARAIIRFSKDHPNLLVDPNTQVTWPDGLTPLPFQIDCVKKMLSDSHNWLIGDEMGLGKTIEALLYINSITSKTFIPKVLVICPNSLRLNWLSECDKWLSPARQPEMTTTSLHIPHDFVISSYEGAKRWLLALQQTDWDVLIVDEAHYCKTPSAQRSRAVFAIKARRKIYMTGTPIVNYPYELFHLLHNLDGETWHEASGFQYRYCHPTQHKYGRNLQELHSRLVTGQWKDRSGRLVYDHQPIMIRRLKKDVLSQLPRKRRQIIEVPCDANSDLKKLVEYEKKLWASADGQLASDEILAALNLVKEAGGTDEELADIIEMMKPSRNFFFEEMSRVRHQLAIAKSPLLIEHIQECLDSFENGEKLVVFIHHNDVAQRIYDHFKHTIGTVLVTGLSTHVHERQASVDKFQTDPYTKLFIGGMRVSGLGITLTAAHHIIFGELDWTPALLTQCEDRCHRIGQEHPLLIQHFVVEGSMDAFMAKKIITKQKSIKLALDGKS